MRHFFLLFCQLRINSKCNMHHSANIENSLSELGFKNSLWASDKQLRSLDCIMKAEKVSKLFSCLNSNKSICFKALLNQWMCQKPTKELGLQFWFISAVLQIFLAVPVCFLTFLIFWCLSIDFECTYITGSNLAKTCDEGWAWSHHHHHLCQMVSNI